MYAVGGPHAFKPVCREFFDKALLSGMPLATSAEVLQEILHAYMPVDRFTELDDAISLLSRFDIDVWPLEKEDVLLAYEIHEDYPSLSARDLCHLASCRRRGVRDVMTFDQSLRGAFSAIS